LTQEKIKILIVDDDPSVCSSIERVLRPEGYCIQSANSGAEAIQKAQAQGPDLVLLDIAMPGLDGLELCRRLRDNPSTAITPIVMVTARYEEEVVASAIESGADDYIVKPFQPQDLKETIRHVLSLARRGLLSCQLKHNLRLLKEKVRRRQTETEG
jgi:DNA-binding response OmpR family regulator